MNQGSKLLDFSKCAWEERSAFAKLLVYQGAQNLTVAIGEMKPGGPHKPHAHRYEQVILVISGQALLHIGDQFYPMTPGCIMAIPPDAIHMFEPVGEEPVYYVDLFSPKRPDRTGGWTDSEGVERQVLPREERIQSLPTEDPEKRAIIPFLGKQIP